MADPLPSYERTDLVVPENEARVAGCTNYINRLYSQESAEVYGL